jgi:hypothetical protein
VNDEEAQRLLRSFQASLAELEAVVGFAARHALPEEGGDMGVREQLRLVLDEYEALLVDAPKMLQYTMDLIGARTMNFRPDPDDARLRLRETLRRDQEDALAGVTFSRDSVGEWLEIAREADKVISELRGRLDG